MEVSISEEINQIQMRRAHIVILGAGASFAAFPNGDKFGRKLPIMNNFIEILNLKNFFINNTITLTSNNFEEIYAKLCKDDSTTKIRQELEKIIYSYFSNLEIPDNPTIYDHLLISLREKDVVATFNWDPFLLQAYQRNCQHFKLPTILFLHGNVATGYCTKDKVAGVFGTQCKNCNKPLSPVKLLYPVSEKNYHEDGFISSQWNILEQKLKTCFMVTIFGYGAPESDKSAIDLLKNAWGDTENREMEQIEIIDIKEENVLSKNWEPFIHSHHYDVFDNFYDSWIANHPRRTGEAFINQYIDSKFIDDNEIPQGVDFTELRKWFKKLLDVELENSK